MQLGGNIELLGFKNTDRASIVVLKKIIGNYGRQFSTISGKLEKLSVTMKLCETEETSKYEIHAKLLINGKPFSSEVVERNLFVAVDNALKKIESQLV